MTPLRRTVALVALLAYFALSTVGAGWVVCTGANGHVAVESLAAGCCSGGDEAAGGHAAAHDDWRDEHGHEHDACGDQDVAFAWCDDAADVEVGAHIGCGECNDCGDCDDVALSDLTRGRLKWLNDAPTLPAALPAHGAVAYPPTAALRSRVTSPQRTPRPPPRHAELACTILRL